MSEEHPFGRQLEVVSGFELEDGSEIRCWKDFDNGYSISTIRHNMSYGGKQGLYEIAVFYEKVGREIEGITDEGDYVAGWLTYEDVLERHEKVKNLQPNLLN